MKLKNITSGVLLSLLLSGCASDPIDSLDPTQAGKADFQQQCPIGYEPVYSTEFVIKSTDDDKKSGQTRKTFKCELIR